MNIKCLDNVKNTNCILNGNQKSYVNIENIYYIFSSYYDH